MPRGRPREGALPAPPPRPLARAPPGAPGRAGPGGRALTRPPRRGPALTRTGGGRGLGRWGAGRRRAAPGRGRGAATVGAATVGQRRSKHAAPPAQRVSSPACPVRFVRGERLLSPARDVAPMSRRIWSRGRVMYCLHSHPALAASACLECHSLFGRCFGLFARPWWCLAAVKGRGLRPRRRRRATSSRRRRPSALEEVIGRPLGANRAFREVLGKRAAPWWPCSSCRTCGGAAGRMSARGSARGRARRARQRQFQRQRGEMSPRR